MVWINIHILWPCSQPATHQTDSWNPVQVAFIWTCFNHCHYFSRWHRLPERSRATVTTRQPAPVMLCDSRRLAASSTGEVRKSKKERERAGEMLSWEQGHSSIWQLDEDGARWAGNFEQRGCRAVRWRLHNEFKMFNTLFFSLCHLCRTPGVYTFR